MGLISRVSSRTYRNDMAETQFTQVLLSENEEAAEMLSSSGSVEIPEINPDQVSIQFNNNNNTKKPSKRRNTSQTQQNSHNNNTSLQFDSTTSNSIPTTPTKF